MPKALMAVMERARRPKSPPRFADEGEPEETPAEGGDDGSDRDMEAEEAEAPAAMPGEREPSGYAEHVEMAIDDLADIAGVAPEDRKDYGAALQAVIHAAVADALAGRDEEPEEEPSDEEVPTDEE